MAVHWPVWLDEKIAWWRYEREENGGSIISWWWTLQQWWDYRPMRVPCAFCGALVWSNGEGSAPTICNRYCYEAYELYGPPPEWDDSVIPF